MNEEHLQALGRVDAALAEIEPKRPALHRITVERVGSEIKVICWCGKARMLRVEHINVFCRAFNDFLYEHSWCEPGGNE